MASNDKYVRGSSGYSKEDEKKAKEYGNMVKRVTSDANRRKAAGEKGIVFFNAESSAKNAEENFKTNLKTEEGRQINEKNTKFTREVDLPKANSRAQYDHERDAGDPNALQLSFEEWKKL